MIIVQPVFFQDQHSTYRSRLHVSPLSLQGEEDITPKCHGKSCCFHFAIFSLINLTFILITFDVVFFQFPFAATVIVNL